MFAAAEQVAVVLGIKANPKQKSQEVCNQNKHTKNYQQKKANN